MTKICEALEINELIFHATALTLFSNTVSEDKRPTFNFLVQQLTELLIE